MFGDILSDLAAAVTGGSVSLPPPASATPAQDSSSPCHGSAPDIAGHRGVANPAAMLRSTALMLAHGLDRPDEANALEQAVDQALRESPTPDLGGRGTTAEFSDAVLQALV